MAGDFHLLWRASVGGGALADTGASRRRASGTKCVAGMHPRLIRNAGTNAGMAA